MIAVVVLNWNNAPDTIECMDSLLRQRRSDYHIWLLDNASEEDDFAQLRSRYASHSRVTIRRMGSNLGFAAAHNRAFEEILAAGEEYRHIALLNNDAVAAPDWLDRLVECAGEEEAGMVASKLLYYYDEALLDNCGHRMLNTGEIIPIGHMQPEEKYNRRFENFGPCAGAALYSRKMIADLGGFDPFFHTGYEDAELGARAVICGYRSVFEPSALALHKISRSVVRIQDENYLARIQLNIFYSYFKLMPMSFLWWNAPQVFFKYGLLLLLNIITFRHKMLRIHWWAIRWALGRHRRDILRARREFQKGRETISAGAIWRRSTFFLGFDARRFYRFYVRRERTSFER